MSLCFLLRMIFRCWLNYSHHVKAPASMPLFSIFKGAFIRSAMTNKLKPGITRRLYRIVIGMAACDIADQLIVGNEDLTMNTQALFKVNQCSHGYICCFSFHALNEIRFN